MSLALSPIIQFNIQEDARLKGSNLFFCGLCIVKPLVLRGITIAERWLLPLEQASPLNFLLYPVQQELEI